MFSVCVCVSLPCFWFSADLDGPLRVTDVALLMYIHHRVAQNKVEHFIFILYITLTYITHRRGRQQGRVGEARGTLTGKGKNSKSGHALSEQTTIISVLLLRVYIVCPLPLLLPVLANKDVH